MNDLFDKLLEKYPFLSHVTYGGEDYIGIIQNKDAVITSIYDFHSMRDDQHKKDYLELADQWWWESNRMLPINIFLKQDWVPFRACLKSFNSKDVEILAGPYVSLSEISTKRVKRRSITLIRKIS